MTETATRLIHVILNGAPLATEASTLADLVTGQGFEASNVATAINGDFVAKARRAETPLAEHDRIEILSARQGG